VTVLDHVDHRLRYALDGVQRQCVAVLQPGDGAELSDTLHLVQDAAVFSVREATPYPARRDAADPGCARAPMAGTVVALQVAAGDSVREGDPLVCIEAMKMELWLHARAAGRVAAVHVQLKDSVAAGSALVDIDLPTEPDLPP
jgi:geranyl-CoA carboxylase alpha subunit